MKTYLTYNIHRFGSCVQMAILSKYSTQKNVKVNDMEEMRIRLLKQFDTWQYRNLRYKSFD